MLFWRAVVCSILFALLTGCSPFVREPAVVLKDTAVIGLDSAGVDLEVNLGVTNSNSFDLSLLGYTFDLQVMNLPLSSGGGQQTVTFPADRETGLRLPVRLKFSDLLEILKRSPDPARIPYRVAARLHIQTPLGESIIPVEKESLFSLPEQYRPSFYQELLRSTLKGLR